MSLFLDESGSNNGLYKADMKKHIRDNNPEELRKTLEEYKKSKDFSLDDLNDGLLQATKQNQAEMIPIFAEFGADLNFGEFKTPLLWALLMGKEEAAVALIESGADVDFGNPPPITTASSLGRIKAVRLMLQKNVDVNATDSDGRTALDLAKNYKKAGIVKLLREHGGTSTSNPTLGHYTRS